VSPRQRDKQTDRAASVAIGRVFAALRACDAAEQCNDDSVASLLFYVVFFDLNRLFIVRVCFPDCQFLFISENILPFLPLICHCFQVLICVYVCYALFNKYSILNSHQGCRGDRISTPIPTPYPYPGDPHIHGRPVNSRGAEIVGISRAERSRFAYKQPTCTCV